jgi:hypothetical protein
MGPDTGKVPPAAQGDTADMNKKVAGSALPTEPDTTDVAGQYAQYVELAGIAKLVSDDRCWDEGISSSVSSFIVGYNSPST